jgi:hypothetical protein
MASYLERYLAGEHETVWSDLVALGTGALQPPVLDDVVAVAQETMRRATANVRILADRLKQMGYQFHSGIEPFEPCSDDVQSQIEALEEILGGPLPLTLSTWYEQIGAVCFMGSHDILNPVLTGSVAKISWDSSPPPNAVLTDPLVVIPLGAVIDDVEGYLDDVESSAGQGFPGPIALAPDELHKANISGATWDMELPCAGADAPFGRWPGFVPYLREVCAWGGFPGWSREANPPRDQIAFLTKDLLPF